MATPDTLFQNIYDGYNETFSSGGDANIANGLAAAAGSIQGCLGLYVLICGILIITGSLSFKDGMNRCIRALLIVALMTPATYNQWVTTVFTKTMPDAISTSTGGTANASAIQVFDQLLASDEAMDAQVLTTAGSSVYNVGEVISAYIAMVVAGLSLLLAFFVWFLAYALIYVVVAAGPYVLLFWLFDATRDIPMRLFGKLIGYLLLMVMVMGLTQIIQNQEKTYVRTFSLAMTNPTTSGIVAQQGYVTPDGLWVEPPPTNAAGQIASGGNLKEQVSILWKIAMAFGFGAGLMLMLPGIAAYVGGGVAIQIAPILNTVARMMGV